MEISNSFLSLDQYLAVLGRLLAAVFLGGLIGIERGGSKHDAGLRTHIILCLGAASVMIVSELITVRFGMVTDITRLGAQVISGIGFLGVGSIIVTGNKIRGLTTAAGLWTTACVGLVIGAGFLEVATTIVLLMMFTMYVLRPLTLKIQSDNTVYVLTASTAQRSANEIINDLSSLGYDIQSAKAKSEILTLYVRTDDRREKNELLSSIMSVEGIIGVVEK